MYEAILDKFNIKYKTTYDKDSKLETTLWIKNTRKIYQWCIKHGVKIYSVPCGKGEKNKTVG